jgi:alkylhydroperoxidase family enzyme
MPYIDLPPGDEPPPVRVWRHRPEQGRAFSALAVANWQHSQLSTREREAARHRVAQLNGCITCQNWRVEGFAEVGCTEEFYEGIEGATSDPGYSRREQLAVEMAERFSLTWTEVGQDVIDELRRYFTDSEIVDLLICIGQYVAQGRLMHILDCDSVCSLAPAHSAVAR